MSIHVRGEVKDLNEFETLFYDYQNKKVKPRCRQWTPVKSEWVNFKCGFQSYKRTPQKHVLLLHGPPRTGKTCMALAFANSANCDLYVMPRFQADQNGEWLDEKPAVLLWGEFDLVHNLNVTDNAFTAVVRSILDGYRLTNFVMFLTTNYPEKLCPITVALGRVDSRLEIGWATEKMKLDALAEHPESPYTMSDFEGQMTMTGGSSFLGLKKAPVKIRD